MHSNILDNISADSTTMLSPCVLKEFFLEKYNIDESQQHYIYQGYVLATMRDDGITLSIFPQDKNLGFSSWFRFLHASRLLQQSFPGEVHHSGNTCILRSSQEDRLRELFACFCMFLEFPPEDEVYRQHRLVSRCIDSIGWHGIVESGSFFVAPQSLATRSLLLYTPFGQVFCNGQPTMPIIGEPMREVKIRSNQEIIAQHLENISQSDQVWVEGDDIFIRGRAIWIRRYLQAAFSHAFKTLRGGEPTFFEYVGRKIAAPHKIVGTANPYASGEFFDKENSSSLHYSIFR